MLPCKATAYQVNRIKCRKVIVLSRAFQHFFFVGLSVSIVLTPHFSTHASLPCPGLVELLAKKTRNAGQASKQWLAHWKTAQGRKDNLVGMFFKDARAPNPHTFFGGWMTRIDHLPANAKWYQYPLKRIVRQSHVKVTESVTQALTGKKYSPPSTYYLSLFNGLNETLVNAPNLLVRPISAKLLHGAKKELRLPYILGAFTFYTYPKIDSYFKEKHNAKLTNELDDYISKNQNQIDDSIFYDMRYAELRERVLNGDRHGEKMSIEDARLLQVGYMDQLNRYYHFMETEFQDLSPEAALDNLLQRPAFAHIRDIAINGNKPAGCFRVSDPAKQEVSTEMIQELVDINHIYLAKSELMSDITRGEMARRKMFKGASLEHSETLAMQKLNEMQRDPNRKIIIDDILNDPYAKALFTLHERNILVGRELVFRLQEDAHYQRKFLEWSTLGMAKFIMDENDNCTEQPLTLEDIRRISLAEIKRDYERKRTEPVSRAPSSIDTGDQPEFLIEALRII